MRALTSLDQIAARGRAPGAMRIYNRARAAGADLSAAAKAAQQLAVATAVPAITALALLVWVLVMLAAVTAKAVFF